ncbi:hypothetical protein KBD71_00545 [Candidatus Woesebacteria bacterium]|nr:hypothetical protein [Candidatus Woesebacteria bacterium]
MDRKLQQAKELRDSATSVEEKAQFAAEAERLAKMMTVLELDTGLTSQMIERRQKQGVHTMTAAYAEKYGSSIKESMWKSLSLTEAIDKVADAWKKEKETHKDDPAYLTQREKAFNDARILLMQLQMAELTIR